MWTWRQVRSGIGVGTCAALTAIACGKVDRKPGDALTEPEPAAAGQTATQQPDTGGGSVGSSGGSATSGGANAGITQGGNDADAGADGVGGAAISGPGCVVDANGMCVSPTELLLGLPGCGKLQLHRDGDTLLVLSVDAAQLWRIGLVPRATPKLLASELFDAPTKAAPSAFTTDGKSAYVAAGVTITRVDLGTGATATVTTVGHPIVDVAFAGGMLYYIRGTELVAVDAAGTNTVGHIQTIADGGIPRSIAFTYGQLIWAEEGSSQLTAKQLPDGTPYAFSASQAGLLLGPGTLQVDTQHAYWVNFRVKRAPLNEPSFIDTFGTTRGEVTAFALNAEPSGTATVAYTAASTGDIEGSTFFAPTSTWLARDVGTVTSLAADDAHVYAATTDCNVLAVPTSL